MKGRSPHAAQPPRYNPEPIRDDSSILGGRISRNAERKPVREDGPLDAFSLFCAYHLGITREDGYQKPQHGDVARRYNLTPEMLQSRLTEFGIDEDAIRRSRFDLEGAQMDIRIVPPGISRTEIARDLFEDYLQARNGNGE